MGPRARGAHEAGEMGYHFGRGQPAWLVTTREYLTAFDRASVPLAHEANRGSAYRDAIESLGAGHPTRAVRMFSSMLARTPRDPALHRRLGITYFCSGALPLAAHHPETALRLLASAGRPGIPLVRTLQIEFEAGLVRLALVAVYDRLGHRADTVRCLRQEGPLGWPR